MDLGVTPLPTGHARPWWPSLPSIPNITTHLIVRRTRIQQLPMHRIMEGAHLTTANIVIHHHRITEVRDTPVPAHSSMAAALIAIIPLMDHHQNLHATGDITITTGLTMVTLRHLIHHIKRKFLRTPMDTPPVEVTMATMIPTAALLQDLTTSMITIIIILIIPIINIITITRRKRTRNREYYSRRPPPK